MLGWGKLLLCESSCIFNVNYESFLLKAALCFPPSMRLVLDPTSSQPFPPTPGDAHSFGPPGRWVIQNTPAGMSSVVQARGIAVTRHRGRDEAGTVSETVLDLALGTLQWLREQPGTNPLPRPQRG